MDKPDFLYELAASLTKAEKRYFSLWAGRTEGNKNYLRLWEAIEKTAHPSDEVLKKNLAGEKWVRNFAYEKNYLYKQIITCLRVYHEDLTPEVTLHNRLIEIKILHEKGLYDQSLKMINKYMPEVAAYQFTSLENNYIKALELNDDARQDVISILSNLKKRRRAKYQVVQRLYERLEIDYLYDIFMMRLKEKNSPGSQLFVEKFAGKVKMLEDRKYLTLKAEQMAYHIISIWYFLKNDLETSLLWMRRMIGILEKTPSFLAINYKTYFSILNNTASRCAVMGRTEEFYQTIHKMRSRPDIFAHKKYLIYVHRSISSSIQLEVLFHIFKNTPDALAAHIQDLEEQWNKVKNNVSLEHHITNNISFGSYFFRTGEYKKALKYLNVIFGEGFPPHFRIDLRSLARLLRALAYLAQQDEKGWELGRKQLDKQIWESNYRNEILTELLKDLDKLYEKNGTDFSAADWKKLGDVLTEKVDQFPEDRGIFVSAGLHFWMHEMAEKKQLRK